MEIVSTNWDVEPDEVVLEPQEDEMPEEEVQHMLRMIFYKYNQSKFSEIESAISSGDIELAHRLVHTLKGNAGQVGKTLLFHTAEKIESMLMNGEFPIPKDLMFVLESNLSDALMEFKPLVDEAHEIEEPEDAVSAYEADDSQDTAKEGLILVVDENTSNARVLSRILGYDYKVIEAHSGQEAIGIATERLPDLVLLEVHMSDMDGFEVTKALKNDDKTKEIPVVFITGISDTGTEEKALNLGAADFIAKPFSPSVVKLRIRNQVRVGRLHRDVETALTASQAASRAKSDFLAKMSNGLQMLMNAEFLRNIGHELKTSLTRIHSSIINAADLLDYGMDKNEMLESLEDAGSEIMKMADLINCEISRFAGEGVTDG